MIPGRHLRRVLWRRLEYGKDLSCDLAARALRAVQTAASTLLWLPPETPRGPRALARFSIQTKRNGNKHTHTFQRSSPGCTFYTPWRPSRRPTNSMKTLNKQKYANHEVRRTQKMLNEALNNYLAQVRPAVYATVLYLCTKTKTKLKFKRFLRVLKLKLKCFREQELNSNEKCHRKT